MRRIIAMAVVGFLIGVAAWGQNTKWQDFPDLVGDMNSTGIYLFFEPGPGDHFNLTGQQIADGVLSINLEGLQDITGAMVSGNVETGIVVTYDDAGGKLDFVVPSASAISIDGNTDGNPEVFTTDFLSVNVDPLSDGTPVIFFEAKATSTQGAEFMMLDPDAPSPGLREFRIYRNVGGGEWVTDSEALVLRLNSNEGVVLSRAGLTTYSNQGLINGFRRTVRITNSGLGSGPFVDITHDGSVTGIIESFTTGHGLRVQGCVMHGPLAVAPTATLCAQYFDTSNAAQCISNNGSSFVQMDDNSTVCV